MKGRRSGILLHITSLPSPHGIGDLGSEAFRFADFLSESAQSVWQVLPLNPTQLAFGHSPYSSSSAFAGNTVLISLDDLARDGWLDHSRLSRTPVFAGDRVDYRAAAAFKQPFLDRAVQIFRSVNRREDSTLFEDFCRKNTGWLADHALFVALKKNFAGRPWRRWPPEFRDRKAMALQRAQNQLKEAIEREKVLQYFFFRQWDSLKSHCNRLDIEIMGDLPYYVSHDSADAWTNRDIFKLKPDGEPAFVGGTPPDNFSRTGQLWRMPAYDWEALKSRGYDWWIERIRHHSVLFDQIRIDHFCGLVSYWEIPGSARTAKKGQWQPVPAEDFLKHLFMKVSKRALIAEDLGFQWVEASKLLKKYRIPGMRILQSAFSEDTPKSIHAPHHHNRNSVVYTGTHDHNTARGWFEEEATRAQRRKLSRYSGRRVTAGRVHEILIRLAMMSVADLAIIPMQDILGLDARARMNRPAAKKGNWKWRLVPGLLTSSAAGKLRNMTELYGRG